MMRKDLFSCIVILLAIFVFFSAVCAEEMTVDMDGLEMKIDIPGQYIILMQDGFTDESASGLFDFSVSDAVSYMKGNNIYIDVFSADGSHEITIICSDENTLKDFNEMGETSLSTFLSLMASSFEELGISASSPSIYTSPTRRFILINYSVSGIHGIQYNTVCTDKTVNITLRSYTGEVSETQKSVLKAIVDSIEFTGSQPLNGDDQQKSDAFTYTDPETNTTFLVPENWVEESLFEPRETIDTKFACLEDSGLVILFGSNDILAMLGLDILPEILISTVDNRYFPKEDFAEQLEVDSSEIEVVNYGANEFYKYSVKSDSLAEIPLSVNMTYYMTVDHGYLYFFQFNGNPGDEHFADMESMLASIKFGSGSRK